VHAIGTGRDRHGLLGYQGRQPLPIDLARPAAAWLAGSDVALLATLLLEPPDPGTADLILLCHLLGGQARIAIIDHPLPQIHRVSFHGQTSCLALPIPDLLTGRYRSSEIALM
jgi:hypothetical protein